MQKIVGLSYVNENQVLAYNTQSYCTLFRNSGREAEAIDLSLPNGVRRLQDMLRNGEIDFCFGLQGVGSRLTIGSGESVWSHYKTPFLALHHDNPCCNIYNHFCDSPYVGNLYLFKCLFDIQEKYVNNGQHNEFMPFETTEIPYLKETRFKDRPLRLTFIKTGKSPDACAQEINQIKPPLREAIWAVIEQARKNENLMICDLLAHAFASCGHDYKEYWAEFWGFSGFIDSYIRTKRAADMVEWLKTQEGAVIIGDGWDFIDKTGAKAIFKPSIPAQEACALYSQSQFTFNTSPYGYDIIHERVTVGLCNHSFVISDSNAWFAKHFTDIDQLYLFRWNHNLQEQMTAAINTPHVAEIADAGLGRQRIGQIMFGQNQIPKMIDVAAKVRAFATSKK